MQRFRFQAPVDEAAKQFQRVSLQTEVEQAQQLLERLRQKGPFPAEEAKLRSVLLHLRTRRKMGFLPP